MSKSSDHGPTTATTPVPEAPSDPLLEIGSPGLQIYSGWTKEEFLPELSGGKASRVYLEMSSNDPIVGAVLFAVRMLMRGASWTIRAASAAPEDEEAAEFLRTCMVDMSHSWTELIDEALSMLIYGYSLHELVYKRRLGMDAETPSRYDDGRIGWARLPVRTQLSVYQWVHDEWARDILGVWQSYAPPKFERVFIPSDRLLLFRPTVWKGNPEGSSILRNAYRPYFMKKHIENFEAIGVERDLAGIPLIGVPPQILGANATTEQKAEYAAWKRIATNLRMNEQAGIIYPRAFDKDGHELYKIELLSSSARRLFDTSAIINRYDQRIAMTVLADFILIGHEHAGSFALNSSKTDLFAVAIGAWLDRMQDVLNRQAVPRLWALNPEFRLEALPTFVHGDVETPDLAELGGYISALAGAGINLATPEVEEELKRVAHLPTTESEER